MSAATTLCVSAPIDTKSAPASAKRAAAPGECDCVTFTGIGLWSLDMTGPHMATVQISTAPDASYVSILLDGGMLSNVNTKPAKSVMPLPGIDLG